MMGTQVYWAKSVDVGSCSSCGARGISTDVIVVRVEMETGTWEIRFCKPCAVELTRNIKKQLGEK